MSDKKFGNILLCGTFIGLFQGYLIYNVDLDIWWILIINAVIYVVGRSIVKALTSKD